MTAHSNFTAKGFSGSPEVKYQDLEALVTREWSETGKIQLRTDFLKVTTDRFSFP